MAVDDGTLSASLTLNNEWLIRKGGPLFKRMTDPIQRVFLDAGVSPAEMDDLVMVSCHVHSKIMARNELAAVPIQPEHMAYEYGYAATAGAAQYEGLQFLLMEICREVQKELS